MKYKIIYILAFLSAILSTVFANVNGDETHWTIAPASDDANSYTKIKPVPEVGTWFILASAVGVYFIYSFKKKKLPVK